jgi:tRNA-Thr(GGU) m(6)t(6)A37 methyltransferase TsaA
MTYLEASNMKGKIEYRPIGLVHSPFKDTEGMPIQPSRAKGIRGTVEILPDFVEGLADLDGFSHIVLLCHLHEAGPHRLKVVPFLDHELRGVFATRAPCRPNPIGLSVVRLIKIRGHELLIEGVDLLDGTPVLDIKPYVGDFDRRAELRLGWLDSRLGRIAPSDKRFG